MNELTKLYCNNCGNELEKEDRFCSKCGNNIKNSKEKIEGDGLIKLLNTVIILFFIISFIVYTINTSYRSVENNDFEIKSEFSFTSGVALKVKANEDIKDLKLRIIFVNKYSHEIGSITEDIGTVDEGEIRNINIGLDDISISGNIFDITNIEFKAFGEVFDLTAAFN